MYEYQRYIINDTMIYFVMEKVRVARHIQCVYMYTYNDYVMFMYYYLYIWLILFFLVEAKVDVSWESLKHQAIELMFMWGGDVPTFASPGTTNQQLGSVKAASVLAP